MPIASLWVMRIRDGDQCSAILSQLKEHLYETKSDPTPISLRSYRIRSDRELGPKELRAPRTTYREIPSLSARTLPKRLARSLQLPKKPLPRPRLTTRPRMAPHLPPYHARPGAASSRSTCAPTSNGHPPSHDRQPRPQSSAPHANNASSGPTGPQ